MTDTGAPGETSDLVEEGNVQQNVEAERGGQVTFTVTIKARVLQNSLKNPYFRFQFLDGTKVLTTAVGSENAVDEVDQEVGAPQGVWSRRPTLQKDENTDELAQDVEITENANKQPTDNEEEEEQIDDTAPWVWTKSFDLLEVDERLARTIDSSPNIAIFLGDRGGSLGRPYIADMQLDVSPFLAGDLEVGATHGIDDPVGWNEETDLSANNFAGFNYLDIQIHASHKILSEELEQQLNPITITINKVKDLPGARLHLDSDKERPYAQPDNFHLLRQNCEPVYCIYKFPSQPMARMELQESENMNTGDTLDKATAALGDLKTPNNTSNNNSEDDHDIQTNGSKLLEPALRNRVCFTCGLTNGEKLRWEHRSAFLAGTLNDDFLYEFLDSKPLTVELHDRDILQSNEDVLKQNAHFEKMAFDAQQKHVADQPDAIDQQNQEGNAIVNATIVQDIFDVDRMFLADREARKIASGDKNSYGVASFRMDSLLSRANELRQGLKRANFPEEERDAIKEGVTKKMTEVVLPEKRRIVPTGDAKIAEWDMCEAERLCRRLGDYAGHETRITATFQISRPVHRVSALEKPPQPVFERIVYLFPYDDINMLQAIRECVDQVNSAAIPNVSLPSYQLTQWQKDAARDGKLDIICGFQIIEDAQRLIVLEGLSEGGMSRLRESLPRASIAEKNQDIYKLFSNIDVLFTMRSYTVFEVDLKIIRLRRPLASIIQSPDIYNRGLVSATCFNVLHNIGELKKANRMRTLKIMDLFPTVEGLIEVESKYGETVTLMDMRGIAKKKKSKPGSITSNVAGILKKDKRPGVDGAVGLRIATQMHGRVQRLRRKAPTDTQNSAYLNALENWTAKDFLSSQAKKATTLRQRTRIRKEKQYEEAKQDPTPVYIYGSQKLNSIALAQIKQREMIKNDTNATYTYAPDFVGQTIAPVDPQAIEEAERMRVKEKFITPKGFVYPAPKDSEEFRRHPKQLTASQIEALQEPWGGPSSSVAIVAPGEGRGSLFDDKLMTASGFDTRSLRPIENFGLLKNDGTFDENFNRSVHLGGEADAQAAEEKKKFDAAEWHRKVVGEQPYMQPVSSVKKSNQIDRLRGMLHDRPKKKGLGANQIPALVPHGPYVEPRELEKKMAGRPTRLPKEELGSRPNFETRINPNFGKFTSTSQRSIPFMPQSEKTGPKWAQ